MRAVQSHFAHDPINAIVIGIPFTTQAQLFTSDCYQSEIDLRQTIGEPYLKGYLEKKYSQLTPPTFIERVKNRLSRRRLDQWIKHYTRSIFGTKIPIDIRFYDHHICHAIAALTSSPFQSAIIVTMDGWGDAAFSTVYYSKSPGHLVPLQICHTIQASKRPYNVPPAIFNTGIYSELSIGHLYSILTHLIGFQPCSDEGKLEALAAYGTVDFDFLNRLRATIQVNELTINIVATEYEALVFTETGTTYINQLKKETVAATTQLFLEELYITFVEAALKHDPLVDGICVSGGVAANVLLNMKLFSKLRKQLHVHPAMSDDGTAEGACYLARKADGIDTLRLYTIPYLGTHYSIDQTRAQLEAHPRIAEVSITYIGDQWPKQCAERVTQGSIGAIYHGRAEFGPRALGNRSIVADLRNPNMTDRLNLLVKNRPGFQPFCPSFLEEERPRLFPESYLNRHMTCCFLMNPLYRDQLPCAVHIDGTARVQFVSAQQAPQFHQFLSEIKALTGFGGCINTSFNKHGRTIVESPTDAVNDFLDCKIDFLMVNGFLVLPRGM